MVTQSEYALEEKFIQQLQDIGYEYVSISNEAEMLANLKTQLEKHNQITVPFSETEFIQVKHYLNRGGIFERAQQLRNRCPVQRDNGETIYLTLIDPDGWCKNEFQVTHQVTMEGTYTNRYDVTLLVNGLPLVQIELKRRGVELKEAFRQINRYQHHSYNAGIGLFQYVQLFIISNGVETKYFSNNAGQSFDFTFYWTDSKNTPITQLDRFTDDFLKPCHISKMIGRYMVLQGETDEKSGQKKNRLVVMRPYQYYAVEAILKKVANGINIKDDGKGNLNGYIWHTTGSGKTLTSFKASQLIQAVEGVAKILFVVDRVDLDYQTINTFRTYAEGNAEAVDGSKNTRALLKRLADNDTKPIVTTIQKLNNAVTNEKFADQIAHLKDKRVVFIFDECHRSQFGETHQNIRKFFRNAQLFGFTGTPIFAENANKGTFIGKGKSIQAMMKPDGTAKTTKDLFGECLHKYTITHAIRDDNVLPFSVEYFGRYKDKTNLDIDVEDIDTQELLESEDRIRKIAKHILQNHNKRTQDKTFVSMFAVSSVDVLIKYYRIFKEEQENLKTNLRIGAIFSYSANDADPDRQKLDEASGNIPEAEFEINANKMSPLQRDALENCIQDYNQMFGTSYSTKSNPDAPQGKYGDPNNFYAYYKDISKKTRDGQIDILLVVAMFLTGFDAPKLNTLYVDKSLRYHGLLQAFSRTNRMYNANKRHGKIVCYRNLKKRTDDAISLFSDESNASSTVLVGNYEDYVSTFNRYVIDLKKTLPDTEDFTIYLQSEEDQLKFIRQYRELLKLIKIIKSFAEYNEPDLKLSEQQMADYGSVYLTLYDEVKHKKQVEKVSILKDVDFSLELLERNEINVAYILRLLENLKKEPPVLREIKQKEITGIIESAPKLRSKKELIEKFIIKELDGITGDIDTAFNDYVQREAESVKQMIADEERLDPIKLDKVISDYQYTHLFPKTQDIIELWNYKPALKERRALRETLTQKIKKFFDVFVDGF